MPPPTTTSCYYHICITTLIIAHQFCLTMAAASCANAPASKQCCSGQSDSCKTQDSGIFCWCDAYCVANSDCCWDYYIVCVSGVTITLLNLYTGRGGQRINNIENVQSTINAIETTSTSESSYEGETTSKTETTSSGGTISTNEITSTSETTSTETTPAFNTRPITFETTLITETEPIRSQTMSSTETTRTPIDVTMQVATLETNVQSTQVTGVFCKPFPTWLDIETSNISPVYGDTVSYSCKSGFHFSDLTRYKDNSCHQNGDWVQEFYTCSANNSAGFEVLTSKPVEAPGAIYIGTGALLFLVIEAICLFIMDMPHFIMIFSSCNRRRNKTSNKSLESCRNNSNPRFNSIELTMSPQLTPTISFNNNNPFENTTSFRSRRVPSSFTSSFNSEDVLNKSDSRTTVTDIIVDVEVENMIFI